jgi:hypothetical protein
MSITKTGIWTSEDFQESGQAKWSNPTLHYEYAPVKDTTNSCMGGQLIRFTDIPTTQSTDVRIRIELDITWAGGFAATSTAGTFSMNFQGANYKNATNTTAWEGTNYICNILNSIKTLTSLVTGAANGTYHYSCTTTIPANWFTTYNGGYLGIRTNYANNGTATVKISNIKIYPEEYYSNGTAHVHKNYVAANSFIEI